MQTRSHSQTIIGCLGNIKRMKFANSDKDAYKRLILHCSSSFFPMTTFILSDLLHIHTTSATYLPIFEVFVLYNFTSSWILEFFYYFSLFITVSIDCCLLSDCFLLAILYDGLLANGLTHSSTHSTKAT